MGAMGGLLGLNGGLNGSGVAAPTGTMVVPGANAGQLQTAYTGAQNSLASQQALLQALQAQGGLQNQSQVYNQLQGVANGTGPNPAQAMLNQATGQNVANQAALMAGQRGASGNAGLIARQAAMQGAATQQNALGQAATLQANQSLNALGAAGNMANQQAQQQISGVNANTQAQQGEQQILQNANTAANNANVNMQGNLNTSNTGIASSQMAGTAGMIGGIAGGVGTALTAVPKYQGGMIPGPMSHVGRFMAGGSVGSRLMAGGNVPGQAAVPGNSPQNDKVKALLSPGELVVDRETMADKGPAGQAARFLAATIAAKKRGKK